MVGARSARILAPVRRVPSPLRPLLLVVAIVGLCWALLVPPWQSPDELAHYAYAQSMGESLSLPGTPGRPIGSTDQNVADTAVGASRTAFFPRFSPPSWSPAALSSYRAQLNGRAPPSRTDGGGASTASGNPPFFYLVSGLTSRVDHAGTAFGRLYTERLLGVLLLLATTVFAWLLAGEVFGRRRTPQLVCAATTALLPMTSFMSTNVNPDAMLIVTWTAALWLGCRVINRRAPTRDAVLLCAVTALAVLSKATSYALVPPVLLALGVGFLRRPREERVAMLPRLAVALAVLIVPTLLWLGLAQSLGGTPISHVSAGGHAFNLRQFLSYVWQFYLPRLPFLTPFRTTPGLPVNDIWTREMTGVFGWADVDMPGTVYVVCRYAFWALVITTVVLLVRRRPRAGLSQLAFFAVAGGSLLLLLHITEYRVLIGGGGQFLQGRYLLPLAALLGLAAGLVVGRLPVRVRAPGVTVLILAILILQTVALGTVLETYYV